MIEEGVQKNEWNEFVASQKHSPFLQSFEWGEFQKILGFESTYYVIRDHENKIYAGVRVVTLPLIHGKKYWYCPGGFVGKEDILLHELSSVLIERAQKSHIPFVRYDILHSRDQLIVQKSSQTRDAYPRCTRILDCFLGENELLKGFHEKTRYNIRLSHKRGVIVMILDTTHEKHQLLKDEVYSVLKATGDRHTVRAYPQRHFDALWSLPYVTWYVAYKNEKIHAVQAVIFFGDTALYLHGGSLYEYRSDMAPYALQWKAIQDACKRGYHYYDLWGISSSEHKNHPLKNVSRFKEGFGGKVYCGKGTFDVVNNQWLYKIYQCARFLRRNMGRSL